MSINSKPKKIDFNEILANEQLMNALAKRMGERLQIEIITTLCDRVSEGLCDSLGISIKKEKRGE